MKRNNRFLIIFGLIIGFTGCELVEEEDGKNNPEELVGKWTREGLQVGLEITTNSDQEFIDLSKPGIGSGLSIVGDNHNENLKYINPMFMFDMRDEEDDEDDDGPDFFFAAQNLDWTAFRNPKDFVGQTLKMFVMMEDKETIHNDDGSFTDTIVTRAAYFQWVVNDSSNFFMGDRPPDSLYLADWVNPADFTMDTNNNKLELNNMSLYFAEIIQLPNNDDSLKWDSSRVTIASGDLMPATFTIPNNTPTIVATPFMDEEMMEGPPEMLDLQDGGKLELKDTFLDCDDFGNCDTMTVYSAGEWWTEGADTLILAVNFENEGIDTIDLKYLVTANDLKIVYKENPCEYEEDWETDEECIDEISRELIGLQPTSVTSLEIVMNLAFKKVAANTIPANRISRSR
ncbi:MAG: hypothetical protein U9N31_09220 [Candidatus Marinimicrobia bacterium]|nr:hypothetical protein [Candidatus Neomarinimicrobiota bacterium]